MAQRVQVILTDDLDGGEANQTVKFSLDGVQYEIDLSDLNAGKLREALSGFTSAARRTGGRATKRSQSSGYGITGGRSSERGTTTEIREWAKSMGLEVAERGRVPKDIAEKYERAQADVKAAEKEARKAAEAAEPQPEGEKSPQKATSKARKATKSAGLKAVANA